MKIDDRYLVGDLILHSMSQSSSMKFLVHAQLQEVFDQAFVQIHASLPELPIETPSPSVELCSDYEN